MGWTDAQQKVIATRNKNLLVSAAAGSGKTAVLVERIISMITEGEHPLDIDHLLVVTFTNAAAAQMRERIGAAIDKKLLEQPDNKHLQKQISLLQSAQITTIHSFCLNIIRNYFYRIDLDPSFKIAEESEITLMKSDMVSEVLERWYEEGRDDFHVFIESYSYSKSDAPIEDLILQLYGFSMSAPWPKQWIETKRKMFELSSMEDMINSSWMKELITYIRVIIGDLLQKNKQALEICDEPGGPSAYIPALLSDRNLLQSLKNADSYEAYSNIFPSVTYERLSSKKVEGVETWKKDRVKALREEIKKGIKDLGNQYFFQSPEEMLQDLQAAGKIMNVLFDLTLEFMEEFAKKKEEKNLIDFNDLEHFALKILVSGEEDQLPTPAAIEVSEQYDEILIDEYQDSNMVQETMLRAISREDRGIPNRFMVGDVKQSIYKFRLAMPELFMEKYENYSINDNDADGSQNLFQRIDLDKNFRSRKQVLDYVNRIFEQIMLKPVGGVLYDASAALKYGGLYDGDQNDQLPKEQVQRLPEEVELILVTDARKEEDADTCYGRSDPNLEEQLSDSRQKEEEGDEEEAAYTKKELEARAIACRIRELTDPKKGMLVFDQKTGRYRSAVYSDIVILLRSMANWSEIFVNTLMQEGISAFADTGTGYFQTIEIMTTLNMLRIIDNPRQDIPLVGVLYSPMVGMTSTELAIIRTANRSQSMYTALLTFVGDKAGVDEKLIEKAVEFIRLLKHFREMVIQVPIHELIQNVLEQTGYYYYVSAMPGGERRKANLDMLVSQAVRFERGSYSGLFHFIRYMEKLHKYEIDYGEASVNGDQDNTVRIMSIHKSKGLEFPIVFAAGMSKQFNTQDLRSKIVLHNELGVGPEYIDCQLRTKVPTLLKKVIQKKVQTENLGEELRVLYVAMTRAKEKLILTGYRKELEEIRGKEFRFFEIISAKSYLDWVLPAMVNQMGGQLIQEEETDRWKANSMMIRLFNKSELIREELTKQIFLSKDEEELRNLNPDLICNSELRKEVKTRFKFEYPFLNETNIKVKMTVSELKKLGQFADEEQSVNLYSNRMGENTNSEQISTIPSFIRQAEIKLAGTDRGTLYHKVLELLDLEKAVSRPGFKQELERMISMGKLKDTEVNKLNLDYIYGFCRSNVADRMRNAQKAGKLYREKQFVIGRKASEIIQGCSSDELVLIQGIIDAYFEEAGELILLDYKSDLLQEESEFMKRYQLQLEYYRKALEQMTKKTVKEMIIYSLSLGKEIRIE